MAIKKREIKQQLKNIDENISDDDLIAIDDGGLCLIGINNACSSKGDSFGDPEIYLEVGGVPEEENDKIDKIEIDETWKESMKTLKNKKQQRRVAWKKAN